MGRIYKVVLSSAFSNTPNYNTAFYYDWSQIPDQPYKVSFTYTAAANTGGASYLTDSVVAMVYVDVGQGAYNSIASSPSNPNPAGAIYRSNFLGVLEAKTMATSAASGYYSWLSADLTTNAPTYIDTRPRNNSLVVEIRPNSNNLTGDYGTPTPANYVLTLCLEGEK
jgi:hypothetical protein